MKVEDAKLRSVLGIASIDFKQGQEQARHHRHAAGRLREYRK